VIVKSGSAIERLGQARTVLLDKTGTLTLGVPEVEHVVAFDGIPATELLRLAASVDQVSAHVLAEALVHDAQRRGLDLAVPTDVQEFAGQGVEGSVGDARVAVGSSAWLHARGYAGAELAARELDGGLDAGQARILVGVDGTLGGAILMGDHVREDARALVTALHECGVRYVAMVTGDREAVAAAVGEKLGLDRVYAEQSPDGKLAIVKSPACAAALQPVVMVGDGINDAPALALADVGIALGSAESDRLIGDCRRRRPASTESIASWTPSRSADGRSRSHGRASSQAWGFRSSRWVLQRPGCCHRSPGHCCRR